MKYTVEQLHLLIHNCNVYGLNTKKKEYVEMLNELESKIKDNKDEL